ncbi:MAG TPA: NUDIX domain-containing protein [Jiangellales bacterium]|nr:NUDIX domain-containing protein [Jiangellales bacterium]
MSPLAHAGRTDGDGWVACGCGRRHWGRFGAAGLLLRHGDEVLLQHRALWSHEGGTWGLPGGARSSAEGALDGALREAREEAGVPADAVRPRSAWTEDHGAWSYTTVVATADERISPAAGDAESLALAWVAVDEVARRPLHPGLASTWSSLVELSSRSLVILVDGANVVGSRPDGWWHDRAGAARRLRDGLHRLGHGGVPATGLDRASTAGGVSRWWPEITLVVEGAARGVTGTARVRVEDAPGSGDDALVRLAVERRRSRPDDVVVAVTGDRGLRSRLARADVPAYGPRWLLGLLDATG